MDGANNDAVIAVNNLTYRHVSRGEKAADAALVDVNLKIPKGARVLVVGQNGAGKSTLLKIMAGRTIVGKGTAMVLGKNAFHDTELVNEISYLGEWWSQSRNYLDITVGKILDSNADPERVKMLCGVLRVDLKWKLGQLSDGQLRRSQILFGLSKPKPVIILDEITTDVDMLVRDSLLTCLREESEKHGSTILYATHIFEGIEDWAPTHILRMTSGTATLLPTDSIPELQAPNATYFKLVRQWLHSERELHERVRAKDWREGSDCLRVG